MYQLFGDDTLHFEWLRTVGHAAYGGADLAECLVVAERIVEADLDSWYREWFRLAERVRGEAESSLAGGHRVSARSAFLRASNYYRAAEFFLHEQPDDPRILATWRASREAFAQGAALLPRPPATIEVPYEGTSLEGHFYRADGDAGAAGEAPRPTLVFHGGLDSTLEELYFAGAAAAVARGYHCFAFTGPGQGRSIREQCMPFRPDWEQVVTPVMDVVCARPDVDASRVALLGWSLGGYLAPRAAAFERRLAAVIAWDGAFDNFAAAQPMLPEGSHATAAETLERHPRAFDEHFTRLMGLAIGARWAFTHGMWAFGVDSPSALIAAGMRYSLRGLAERIACPTLVCEAESDPFWQGQPRELYDALTCPKTLLRFTADEGAGEHCHAGAHVLFHQRMFDWLDDTLAVR